MENKRFTTQNEHSRSKGIQTQPLLSTQICGVAPNFKNYAHSFKKYLLKDRYSTL